MDDYVSKPVNVNALSDALTRWVPQPVTSASTSQGPEEPAGAPMTIDHERQSLLRGLGPDDGWGLLPMAVDAFFNDCPDIMAAMRDAAETGNARSLGESAHQLKGAASNIGLPAVTALCTEVETSSQGVAPMDTGLLDELEDELVRAAAILHDVVAAAR
jgi:HPt (histidine-containing phosphotransfer) domain-containing protein